MKIHGVQCDTCTKIYPVEDAILKHLEMQLPPGWAKIALEGRELHFCSVACLRSWVTKHLASEQQQSKERQ